MKVIRCFDINVDEKVIYFVREKFIFLFEEYVIMMEVIVSFEIEEGSIEELNMRAENTDMGFLVLKRIKVLCQFIILDFVFGQLIWQKVKSDVYLVVRVRKVKVFFESKIEGSIGFLKIYRMFWNEKVEEICLNSNFMIFKFGEI